MIKDYLIADGGYVIKAVLERKSGESCFNKNGCHYRTEGKNGEETNGEKNDKFRVGISGNDLPGGRSVKRGVYS